MQPPNRASSSTALSRTTAGPLWTRKPCAGRLGAKHGEARRFSGGLDALPRVLCGMLLAQSGSAHGTVLVLLSLSSVFSLYTTTSCPRILLHRMLAASDPSRTTRLRITPGSPRTGATSSRGRSWNFKRVRALAQAGANTSGVRSCSSSSVTQTARAELLGRPLCLSHPRVYACSCHGPSSSSGAVRARLRALCASIEGRGAQVGAVTPELPLVAVF